MTRPRSVELWDVELPLHRPLTTAAGTINNRRVIVVRIADDHGQGWGEAGPLAGHTRDTIDEAWEVMSIEAHRLLASEEPALIDGAASTAALDAALLCWRASLGGHPLAVYLGGDTERVEASAAISVNDPDQVLAEVDEVVADGYRHVKIKIAPGRTAVVAQVRDRHPDLGISVDGNGSFDRRTMGELLDLDALGLVLIEQPLGALDLEGHRLLRELLPTPICLDESIRRLGDIVTVAAVGAADAVSIKPGRTGPTLALRAMTLADRHGLDIKVGGLLASGVGKALDIAVATLPQVGLPSDLTASEHWFSSDLIDPPWVLDAGTLQPSDRPGLGVEVDVIALSQQSSRYRRFPD